MNVCSLLYLLPKNLLSYLTGRLAHIRLPKSCTVRLIHWFATRYGANLSEAANPIDSYPSLGEFFTRDLIAGSRPISGPLVSPVDGAISEQGHIERGLLLQVKGRAYTLADLLRDPVLAQQFEGGRFITFYLAPGDYHHIHAAVAGTIIRTIYIPGKLWPVNAWSLEAISNLFPVNERMVSLLETEWGRAAIVMVGATNVGAISLAYDSLRANTLARIALRQESPVIKLHQPAISVACGERIGTFHMGSTVVLLLERSFDAMQFNLSHGPIKLGAPLADLKMEHS